MAEEVALYVALYLDEDVTSQLAAMIEQRGFRVVSAMDIGMVERPDEEHLTYATEHKMTLFSYNEGDYVELARRWATEGRTHSGILISDQFSLRQIGELLRRILNFLNTVTADEMVNVVRYLADFK
jgi:predicted nuclease of predicted toxin-antitoxin system